MKLKVYSTESCLLCEQVIEKLFALTHSYGIDLTIIDVALNDDLLTRYGEHIPVLEIENKELRSPFNEEKMRLFLERLG